MKTFEDYFFESPKIILELNDEWLDTNMTKHIKKALSDNSLYRIDSNHYSIPISKTDTIVVQTISTTIVGAILVKPLMIDNIIYSEITLSKRYDESQKGFLKTVLPVIQKYKKRLIISGDEHTPQSISAWIRFVKNHDKYGIKNVYGIDKESKKPIDLHKNSLYGHSDKFKNKRIIIDFEG